MNREITFKYSPELIKFAVWKFWTRSIGVGGFVGYSVVVVGCLYFLLSGDRSWIVGLLGSVVLLGTGIGISSYFIYLNRSLEKFKRMDDATAKLHFNDESIGIQSDIGSTELKWKMIEKVWKYPDVWLVFIAKQGYITLPTASLDNELKEFITSKIEVTEKH
jgi:hypothetical protein